MMNWNRLKIHFMPFKCICMLTRLCQCRGNCPSYCYQPLTTLILLGQQKVLSTLKEQIIAILRLWILATVLVALTFVRSAAMIANRFESADALFGTAWRDVTQKLYSTFWFLVVIALQASSTEASTDSSKLW